MIVVGENGEILTSGRAKLLLSVQYMNDLIFIKYSSTMKILEFLSIFLVIFVSHDDC
jgi:hypothetical protein